MRALRAERLGAAIRGGTRLISLDAACNKDLLMIVQEALHSGRRILSVGLEALLLP